MSKVTAIIFDYGRVLSLTPTKADWALLREPFHCNQEDFMREYWGFRYGYDCGEYEGHRYWSDMARAFGVTLSDEQIARQSELDNLQWTRENTPMVDLVRRLHAAGRKTGILSNMQRELHDYMKTRFNWLAEGIFSDQIFSYAVNMAKPDVRIYRLACERMGADPTTTLFLDDKQPNIDGAHAAGLQAMICTGDHTAVERYLAEHE